MKKNGLILVILLPLIAVSVVFQSCKKQTHELLKVEQEMILYNNSEKKLSMKDIGKALDQYDSMAKIFQVLQIHTYKENDAFPYTVIDTDEGPLILTFDHDGIFDWFRRIQFSKSENEKAVSVLRKNMTLEDAEQADPDGDYTLLHTSYGYDPRYSLHFFESGNAYIVYYADHTELDRVVITEIIHFTI